jgi:hypothetical protein
MGDLKTGEEQAPVIRKERCWCMGVRSGPMDRSWKPMIAQTGFPDLRLISQSTFWLTAGIATKTLC